VQVRVLFFGVLKDLAGRASDLLTLDDGAVLADVLEHYEEQIKEWLPAIAASVNQEYASPSTPLHANDEVALLPPVSGGIDQPPAGHRHAHLVRDRIDGGQITASLKHPEDGACVVFDGIVRNNTRGRRTLFLDYEAYEEMALKQMETLAQQAIAQFKVRDVAIVHRLGRLEIGETSVLIVVASAHRGPAFEACRWLIDTLKHSVPIWKKEHFEDGAVWADGEPFPAYIPRAEGSPAEKPASK
jgi:MoaE-MoaD fusion protein